MTKYILIMISLFFMSSCSTVQKQSQTNQIKRNLSSYNYYKPELYRISCVVEIKPNRGPIIGSEFLSFSPDMRINRDQSIIFEVGSSKTESYGTLKVTLSEPSYKYFNTYRDIDIEYIDREREINLKASGSSLDTVRVENNTRTVLCFPSEIPKSS